MKIVCTSLSCYFVACRLTPSKYHASVLSQSGSSNTDHGLYMREKSAYEKLYRSGICSQGAVPDYFGFLENVDVRRWEPEMPAFAQYGHPLNAIFIEYIPGMQMLDIDTFSKARMEKFSHGLKIIHKAHVLHGDPRPRNTMMVTAQGESEEELAERVLWLDFAHAATYCETLSQQEEACFIEEALIVEQRGPLLERSLFASHPSHNFFSIKIRSMTVLSVQL